MIKQSDTQLRLDIVLADDGSDPVALEAIIAKGSSSPRPLNLRSVKAKKTLRATCILLLLAKDRSQEFAHNDGRLAFEANTQKTNWIQTLGDFDQKKQNTDEWFQESFGQRRFWEAFRGGDHSGGDMTAHVDFLTGVLPLDNIRIFTKPPRAPAGTQTPLMPEQWRSFARKLEKRTVWQRRIVSKILRETDHLKEASRPKPNDYLVTALADLSEKYTLKELNNELRYHLRNTGSEDKCIGLLEHYKRVHNGLCNEPLSPFGDAPLLLAISFEQPKVTDYLLSLSEIDVNKCNDYGVTPLLQAARLNDLDLIERLLSKGANPRVRNGARANAIHEVAFGATLDSYEAIKCFERLGVDCNARNREGLIPFAVAIWRKCPSDTTAYLLERAERGGVLDVRDKHGETLVYKAFKNGDFQIMMDVIAALVPRGNGWMSPPRLLPENEDAPLFKATRARDYQRVKDILDKGLEEFKDEILGCSSLHEAVQNRDLEITTLLLESEINPLRRDNHGRTPREFLFCETHLRNLEDIEFSSLLKIYEGKRIKREHDRPNLNWP